MDLTPGADDEVTQLVVDALASSETEPAPPPLRRRVLAAAIAARPAGRASGSPGVELSPIEGYQRTVEELDDLLASIDRSDWRAIVGPYGWEVQGLVGHVLAVERLLGTRLGVDDLAFPPDLEGDHIGSTEEFVTAQQERDPAATLAEWRAAARRVCEALAAPVDLDERVVLHGVRYRWRSLLVARMLEVWTHTDDIRRAIGRPLVAPDEARLALMTDLAVRTLPLRLAASGVDPASLGTLRIVLTDAGGGVWVQALGDASTAPEPDVRVVADAVGFCRLSAGRLTAAELGATIEGDPDLGAAVLAASAAFAV